MSKESRLKVDLARPTQPCLASATFLTLAPDPQQPLLDFYLLVLEA